MEELAAGIATSMISLEDDDISLIHPRYHQYKSRTSKLNQEERRKKLLQEQQCRRLESLNKNRGLTKEGEEVFEETQIKIPEGNEKSPFSNWLMLSVWLVDVPENIEKDYFSVVCPQGKRTLVVAEKGQTKAYSRKGECFMKFPSDLPGGRGENNGFTVIDCIWDHISKTYFIIDVLIWAIPLTNCEAELRFFWLKNKFEESPQLSVASKTNRHKFTLLDHNYVSDLRQKMMLHPHFEGNSPKVDGILFFHKNSLYTSGKSHLTLWLKPFMIKDILGIEIHDNYTQEIPLSYLKKKNKMEVDPKETQEKMSTDVPVL